jgi:hypothetical protein
MKAVQRLVIGVGLLSALASTAQAQTSASATAAGTASVLDPITASKTSDLSFGVIVKPVSGTATVSVSAAGTRTVTGTAAANGGGVSNAAFSVVGIGGSAYSIAVPSTFSMTSGTHSLTVSTIDGSGGGGTLSGVNTSASTASFGVGGAFNLSTATASGAYTGNFTVTASYN